MTLICDNRDRRGKRVSRGRRHKRRTQIEEGEGGGNKHIHQESSDIPDNNSE